MNTDFIFFKNNRKKTLKYFYSFFFGISLVICFPPFNFWPLLFPSLTFIFLKSYYAESNKDAFLIGWFFGLSFFIFGLYWIFNSFLIRSGIYIYLLPICLFSFSCFLSFEILQWFGSKLGRYFTQAPYSPFYFSNFIGIRVNF